MFLGQILISRHITTLPRARAGLSAQSVPITTKTPARQLAEGKDVRIGGGTTTVREFPQADLIDQMHIVVVPILLGRGERLWEGLEGLEDRFTIESVVSGSGVIHLTFTRRVGA
ncbi:dihydrofolate reductase family protein [Kocuria carniphila]|uniref:dihydrofolate reductase family protein n=1 Tax=Kocuria carniphila TaxID=262208 RepID=UPI003F68A045